MQTIKNILVATDLNPNQKNSVLFGLKLANKAMGKLVITHIHHPTAQYKSSTDNKAMNQFKDGQETAIRRLSGFYPNIWPKKLDLKCKIKFQISLNETIDFGIQEIADKEQCDLILISKKRKPGLFKKYLGSIGGGIISSSNKMVLSLPEDFTCTSFSSVTYATFQTHPVAERLLLLNSFTKLFNIQPEFLCITPNKESSIDFYQSDYNGQNRKFTDQRFTTIRADHIIPGIKEYLSYISTDVLVLDMGVIQGKQNRPEMSFRDFYSDLNMPILFIPST